MTEPSYDLSRLKIQRDDPSHPVRRALKLTLWLAALAVVIIVVFLVWMRSTSGPEVTVITAQIASGGGGSATGITANGYVIARTKASVSSRIAGRLAYLGVSEGSVVRRGEIIASLENQDYKAIVRQADAEVLRSQAALKEAKAQRDQLFRDLERAQALFAESLIPEQEIEDLSARLDAAEARVDVQLAQLQASRASVSVAQANLDNTYIRAPFDGTVLRKDAEVGEVVAPVATGGGFTRGAVVTMADLQTLEVEVDVNEAYIAQIQNGQSTRITLDAYPDTTYRGAVRQIVPTADRQRATVLVKISILERDPKIMPEMGARVDFLGPEEASAVKPVSSRIFLPARAVRDEQGQPVVWVVRDNRTYRVGVDAGPVSGERREIRSGLRGGEQVVIDGSETLEEGARVRITKP
jgi:RND family efflux transporter MFP subunit